jgi:hypothetical protein
MRALILALCGVALFGLAATLASGAKVSTKSETATLPSDANAHTLTATCPKGMKATGGGVQIGDDVNDFAQGSYPSGKRGWTAAGYRPNLVEDSTFTAFARCLKGAKLSTESARASIPEDLEAHAATATCPKGTKVSGGGVQLTETDLTEVGGSYPTGKRKWTAVGEAAGLPGDVIATARCLKKAKVVRKSESLNMPDDAAADTVSVKCPKGTKMTGGGAELAEPYEDYLQGSYPTGKREWTAVGLDEGLLTAHVVCLKKK